MFTPTGAYIYRPIKPPCKNCTARAVGCHGVCEEYAEFRARVNAEKKTAYESSIDGVNTTRYEIESAKRYRKGGR